MLLLFRQPFRSGDQIEVQQRAGTVEAITIRETRITTFDGQLVIRPGTGTCTRTRSVWTTAYDVWWLEFVVGIAFDSDIDLACREILAGVAEVAAVSREPAPQAFVSRLASSVVEITVWFWTAPRQANAIVAQHEVMAQVKRRLDQAGVEMPAEIIALQATSSLAAALQGRPVTPGGAVAR